MNQLRKVTTIVPFLVEAAFLLGLLASSAYSFDKETMEKSAIRSDLAARLELAQRFHVG